MEAANLLSAFKRTRVFIIITHKIALKDEVQIEFKDYFEIYLYHFVASFRVLKLKASYWFHVWLLNLQFLLYLNSRRWKPAGTKW